ncbi:hypothetical protein [Calidithermus roseus]|uniref:Uncharacterized protein n=1 Tax=Calidithermus roseus TaxID=1644118 RepID=A0A399EJK0_9DEIN|nr:hypothetical protein [Calidithermus roseus]RIH83480.1 hypothetical protein Mrose_03030 [Calidithermus roseus]
MTANETVWRSLGQGKAHPSDVLNTLIEIDNRRGLVGLWALETDLREALPRLRPQAQALAQAWLEALCLYRASYYPEGRLSKLFNRFLQKEAQPTLARAS